MTFSKRPISCSLLLAAAFSFASTLTSRAETSVTNNTGTNRFGFTGPEIYPIDNQISQLRVADLDGDGLNDLIVVNNARSKINLLYNQTGKTNRAQIAKHAIKREMNELPPD